MKNINYKLTDEEYKIAKTEALRRQSSNNAKRLKGRNGGPESGRIALFYHEIGAIGEMAVASFLDLKQHLYKELNPVRGSYDLPFRIDVKTAAKHSHNLIVQIDDKVDKIYWFVTIENQEIILHGWIEGKYCQRQEFLSDPTGKRRAYFIPKSQLNEPKSFWEIQQSGKKNLSEPPNWKFNF